MKTAHFLKIDKIPFQNLSDAPLNYTTSYGRKFKLEMVTVNSSVPIFETITISLVSSHGLSYSVTLRQYTMNNNKSFVYTPLGENNYQAGDEINVYCTNNNFLGVVFGSIKASEM